MELPFDFQWDTILVLVGISIFLNFVQAVLSGVNYVLSIPTVVTVFLLRCLFRTVCFTILLPFRFIGLVLQIPLHVLGAIKTLHAVGLGRLLGCTACSVGGAGLALFYQLRDPLKQYSSR